MTVRVHPFPSRTRQLSSLVPTILGWKRPGKIGRCQHKENTLDFGLGCFSLSSSLFILPVPANSQLNYGAEVNENDVHDVILQMRQMKLCGLYKVEAASSGLVNGRRLRLYVSQVSFGVLEYGCAIFPTLQHTVTRATASGPVTVVGGSSTNHLR